MVIGKAVANTPVSTAMSTNLRLPGSATRRPHIGAMPVLCLSVPDPGTRGYVERNSIALTSQLAACQDPPSPGWLGHHAIPSQIRQSGLWNVEHVTNPCHPDFLPTLEQLIQHHR